MLFIVSILILIGAVIASLTTSVKKNKSFATIIIAISAVVAFSQTVRVVEAGHVGVIDVFGRVSERTLKPGVNVVNPFARIIKYSVKTAELKETMEVPSREGLMVKLEVSVMYHLDPESAPQVYSTVGYNYQEIIMIPLFRSVVRGVSGSYDAKALYTSARDTLALIIQKQLQKQVSSRGIIVEKTPLRSITLPARLTQAIEEKLQAEQESQRMQFVLLKEKQEAERKRIEAQGIADFQNIVTRGISEPLLRWKGIEATEKLASSQNAKVVIVGGKDGLPLILGSQ